MKIIFMTVLGGLLPLESVGGAVGLHVVGKISRQTWHDAMWGCRKVGSTKDLLPLLKKDAAKFKYSNCTVHETEYSAGHGLHRNCDQIEGYAVFASSKAYCRFLAKPFRGEK